MGFKGLHFREQKALEQNKSMGKFRSVRFNNADKYYKHGHLTPVITKHTQTETEKAESRKRVKIEMRQERKRKIVRLFLTIPLAFVIWYSIVGAFMFFAWLSEHGWWIRL